MPQFPRILGYSSAGVVTAIGEAVTSVKVGDRVAISWSQHRRFVAVPENQVYKLPDVISSSEGALVHISIFPLAAIRKCRLEMGESALVVGLGILGLMAVKLLRAAGAAPIIAVFLDKPGATNYAEFEKLINTVKANNIPFQLGYMYRFNPVIRQAVDIAKSGELGDIYAG